MPARCLFAVASVAAVAAAAPIPLSGVAPYQIYDGHGGLSAGASSRLLLDYQEPYRSDILDWLYKPGHGANLHMCKIEIGGDTQSTDGTEASYKHFREETPACGTGRGYEMWLLNEAYKRNPDVASFILSWGVPRWVGNGSYFSADNIQYQVGYAKCVSETLGSPAHPSYIGIWNERSWGSVDYVVSLREALDAAGLAATRIVVPDGGDCDAVTAAAASNATFASAVYALGEHYPCEHACPATASVGMKFWASEDYSTVADWAGAGCWGRSLSQNWVRLNSTSTIAWSTIWSVYPKDIYFGNGLMYAMTPWSGHYEVNPSIWTSAHHTQFMEIGWHLLQGGSSGMLPGGGSYVAAVSPDGTGFTLVLETLQGNCLRCSGGATAAQDLVFALGTGLPRPGAALQVWQTTQAAPFVRLPDATVGGDGSLAVHVPADAMVTLSTVTTAGHGAPSAPIPADAPFPLPYADDFSGYAEDHLPRFFADQAGSFAVREGALQQLVPADPGPNAWSRNREPYTLLGDAAWADVTVAVTASFNSGPPLGAPGSSSSSSSGGGLGLLGSGEPAAVEACGGALAPYQRWAFGSVAPEYLSTASLPDGSTTCLNVPGCDPSQALIYYECVTTGCECGCPAFTNLQFAINASDGALTTPMQAGLCVTLLASAALALQPCAGGPGQAWSYNASSGALAVTPPAGGAPLCLTAPAPPPAWVGLTARAPPYPNSGGASNYAGLTLRLQEAGAWQVLSTLTAIGNGTLAGPGFNSSAPHALSLAVRGTSVTAGIDGTTVWAGASADFAAGQVALGSGYHYAAFDDFSVAPAA